MVVTPDSCRHHVRLTKELDTAMVISLLCMCFTLKDHLLNRALQTRVIVSTLVAIIYYSAS